MIPSVRRWRFSRESAKIFQVDQSTLEDQKLSGDKSQCGDDASVGGLMRLSADRLSEILEQGPLEFLPDLQATPGHGLRVH